MERIKIVTEWIPYKIQKSMLGDTYFGFIKLFGSYRQACVDIPEGTEDIDLYIKSHLDEIYLCSFDEYDLAAISFDGGKTFHTMDSALEKTDPGELLSSAERFILDLIDDESGEYDDLTKLTRYLQLTYYNLIVGGRNGY